MPDKHEVGGSSPLGPTSVRKDAAQASECISLLACVGELVARDTRKRIHDVPQGTASVH